jgi:hypothetical protein
MIYDEYFKVIFFLELPLIFSSDVLRFFAETFNIL